MAPRFFSLSAGVIAVLSCACAVVEAGKPRPAESQDRLILAPLIKLQKIWVRLPDQHDDGKAYPLLVVLHGNGGTARSLLSAFSGFASHGIILAAPEGPYPKPVGNSIGFSWYYETTDKSVWKQADQFSVEGIFEAINKVSAAYKIDGVFIFGFSQGASLAYMTGLRSPALVRGIAAVGGIVPEIDKSGSILAEADITRAKNVKVFAARGRDDGLVGKDQYDAQVGFFKTKGYDVLGFEYEGGHQLTVELLQKLLAWLKANEKS